MDKSSGKECPGKDTCSDHEKHGSSSLKEVFAKFARFGETHSNGDTITLRNIDKWLQQVDILGSDSVITNADTAITFSKVAKLKKRIDFEEFQEFVEELAKDKEMEREALIDKLTAAGGPEMINVTTPVTSGTVGASVERLTDPSLYTGSSRERFDEEGQGRGLEGREDIVDASGYVQGYKDKDTYDKKTA